MHMTSIYRAALATLAAGACALALAGDILKSGDIVEALTAMPKAIQGADGRWQQRDPSIDLQVQFDFDKSVLTPSGRAQLDELGGAFRQPALLAFAFEVAGHTDAAGAPAHNLKLSAERAAAVRDYLAGRHGIDYQRMQARGYGSEKLADATQPNAAINRRVEIRRLPGGAMGGVPAMPGQLLPAGGGAIVPRQP